MPKPACMVLYLFLRPRRYNRLDIKKRHAQIGPSVGDYNGIHTEAVTDCMYVPIFPGVRLEFGFFCFHYYSSSVCWEGVYYKDFMPITVVRARKRQDGEGCFFFWHTGWIAYPSYEIIL